MTVVEIGFVQTDMLDDLRSNDFVKASFDRYKRLGLARIMPADEVAPAIATAIEKERSHVRLPKRSIAMSMIANAPRPCRACPERRPDGVGESPLVRFAAYSG